VALAAGRQIRPAELGLVASLGISEVAVRRRLRVAFFSTGDEVVTIGSAAATARSTTATATPCSACSPAWAST
jgi:molybdopterin molybdotransferase